MKRNKEYILGCLLGGAIGDALGCPVEFLLDDDIKMKYGSEGITDLVIGKKGKAEITDDTQMTLFTAEGLLNAVEEGMASESVSYVYDAYLAWLHTQEKNIEYKSSSKHWLLSIKELFARREPGITCMGSLKSGTMGTIENPINDSKGCGGVMRVAPVGMIYHGKEAFQLGCQCAATTHGNPSGYISAGILACIIGEILSGKDIEEAIDIALNITKEYKGYEECTLAIKKAVDLVREPISPKIAISKIGEGWVGDEALAIAIYCSLKYINEFEKAIITAVNHDGDSDSTGSITGNILGAYLGIDRIPNSWIDKLEVLEVINHMGDKIYKYTYL